MNICYPPWIITFSGALFILVVEETEICVMSAFLLFGLRGHHTVSVSTIITCSRQRPQLWEKIYTLLHIINRNSLWRNNWEIGQIVIKLSNLWDIFCKNLNYFSIVSPTIACDMDGNAAVWTTDDGNHTRNDTSTRPESARSRTADKSDRRSNNKASYWPTSSIT